MGGREGAEREDGRKGGSRERGWEEGREPKGRMGGWEGAEREICRRVGEEGDRMVGDTWERAHLTVLYCSVAGCGQFSDSSQIHRIQEWEHRF